MKAISAKPVMAGPILDNFTRLTGIRAYHSSGGSKQALDGGAVRVHFDLSGHNFEIATCLLDSIHYDDLSDLIVQRDKNGKLLILAGTIQPRFRKELQRIAVNYLDSSGNAFISLGPLYVFIDGRSERIHGELERRTFSKSILKVIFQLLCSPHLSGNSLRNLSAAAGVSATPIRQALDSLKELGFFLPTGKRSFCWNRKKDLVDKWVRDYLRVLKPELLLGNFSFKDQSGKPEITGIDLAGTSVKWSGVVAAELLTGKKIKGEYLTIYIGEDPVECINRLNLIHDDKGKIKVCKNFWKNPELFEVTVPPLLIYADLLESSSEENRKMAQTIFERYLAADNNATAFFR